MITFAQPQQLGVNTWRLSWTSDQVSPTYRIRIDFGEEIRQTGNFIDVQGGQIVEVLDSETASFSEAHPGWLVLGWNVDSDAAKYRIQEYVGGVWTTRATLKADQTKAWQTYRTGKLTDETTHQWKVIPIDAAGNLGTEVSFSVLMVRNPDVPDVTMTYASGTGRVTIAAA